MSQPRVNLWELGAAFGVLGTGALILWVGSGYSFGSPRSMGPGFFPVVVGALLTAMGAGLVLQALPDRQRVEGISPRSFVMIMLAIFAFAVLMERAGLIPATVCLIVLAAAAERPFRPLRTLLLAVAVTAIGVGIFIFALGLPLRPVVW